MPGARLLKARPLQFFGRISYALYLWHWPLLAAAVLLALPAEGPVLAVTLIAVLLAILFATASTILVEEPICASRIPMLAGRRAVVTGLAGMLVVGLVGVVLTTPVPAAMARTDTFSAALGAARGDRERIIRDGVRDGHAPGRSQGLRLWERGEAERADPRTTTCPMAGWWCCSAIATPCTGSRRSTPGRRVMSSPASSPGAPSVPSDPMPRWLRERNACEAPASDGGQLPCNRIAALHPLLVIASGSTGVPILVDGQVPAPRREGASSAWVGPVGEMLAKLRDRSQANGVPRRRAASPGSPSRTASRPIAGRPRCVPSLQMSPHPRALGAAEAAAADLAGVPFIDPTAWLCPDGRCTWMAGDRVGWVDEHHITSSEAMLALQSLAPLLDHSRGPEQGRGSERPGALSDTGVASPQP